MAVAPPTTPTVGDWSTLKVEVPDVLEDIRATVNAVADVLITFLDIGLTVLDWAKNFLLAFLNPIQAIVEGIINQIRALLNSFRKLGIYFTSDVSLINEWPYPELQGGFSEYERRMIARLTDRTDPTRPDAPGEIRTVAVFFYLSVDISEIMHLVSVVEGLAKFFSQNILKSGGPPTPGISGVKYGFQGESTLSSLQSVITLSGTEPEEFEVAWRLNPNTSSSSYNPFPAMPPGGFVITVSTVPDGIRLVYDRPDRNQGLQPTQLNPKDKQQPREYGPVREAGTGRPVVLHGGADMLKLSPRLAFNPSMQDGVIKPGYTRVYGVKNLNDEAIIPLEQLQDGSDYFLQRTFYIETDFASAVDWASGGYTVRLKLDDLPRDARFERKADGTIERVDLGRAGTYYVRVASCSGDVAANRSYRYDLDAAAPLRDSSYQPFEVPLEDSSASSFSDFSQPFKVLLPTASTRDYLRAVQTAMAVLVLSRADLPVLDNLNIPEAQKTQAIAGSLMIPNVALQPTGLEKMRHLVQVIYEDIGEEAQRRGGSPRSFRAELANSIQRLSLDLYERTGPLGSLESEIVLQTEALRTVTWAELLAEAGETGMALSGGDQTIWQSIDVLASDSGKKASASDYGVAMNFYNMGLPEDVVSSDLIFVPGLIRGRDPYIQQILGGPGLTALVQSASSAQVAAVFDQASEAQRKFYEKHIESDGSLNVRDESLSYMQALSAFSWVESSGDLTPVFYTRRDQFAKLGRGDRLTDDRMGVVTCRHLFAQAVDNRIYQQAALALGFAASATKNRGPGQWEVKRFFDWLPGFEDVFDTILNWVEGIEASLRGVVDQILGYIEFLESRLIELQQLIRRINSLIQSILGFVFKLPAVSALVTVSNGTGGVLSDLVTAGNKPSDSPFSYGAGAAVVIPLFASAPIDLLFQLLVPNPGPPESTLGSATGLTLMGIETLPAPAPPSDEPDVL